MDTKYIQILYWFNILVKYLLGKNDVSVNRPTTNSRERLLCMVIYILPFIYFFLEGGGAAEGSAKKNTVLPFVPVLVSGNTQYSIAGRCVNT